MTFWSFLLLLGNERFMMELVYFWVKEYKNLKEKGIFFSNKFHINFEKEKEVDDSVYGYLKIEKKEPTLNPFSSNIQSMVLLIGENGTGKTSILEVLMNIDLEIPKFLVFYQSEEFYIYKSQSYFLNHVKYKNIEIDEIDTNIIYYSILPGNYRYQNNIVKDISFYSNVRFGNRYDKMNEIVNGLQFYEKYGNKFESLKIPDKLTISLEKHSGFELEILGNPFLNPNDRKDYFKGEFLKFEDLKKIIIFKIIRYIYFQITNPNNKENIQYTDAEKEFSEFFSIDVLKDTNYFEKIIQIIQNIDTHIKPRNKYLIDNYIEHIKASYIEYIEKLFNILESFKFSFPELSLSIDISNQINRKLIREMLSIMDKLNLPGNSINIIGKLVNLDWMELSSGEKNLLLQLSGIDSHLSENKTNLILLDEGETGFHPEWQRRYIQILNEFFNLSKKKVQVILTSHSPLILSDFPISNVRFLEKKEEMKGIKIKQTFAQNIHTILKDGFFIENTIGEFSKKYIEDLVEELNSANDENYENLKQKIELIGEPIIRRRLEDMLREKLSSNSRIEYLKKLLQEEERKIQEKNNDKSL